MKKSNHSIVALTSIIVVGLLLKAPSRLNAQTAIEYGDCLLDSISLAGQINSYIFTGNANDVITVLMGRSTGGLWPQIDVYSPNGLLLKKTYGASSARIDTLKLRIRGNYLILATDGLNGTQTGKYGICLQRTFNPGKATPFKYGATVAGTLSFAGFLNAYTFTGNKNDVVGVQMGRASGALWPQVEVYGPTGALLRKTYGASSARIDTLKLPSGGLYTVIGLDGLNGTQTGTYSIGLAGLSTAINEQSFSQLPVAFALQQNYPNPFRAMTTIHYMLPKSTHVMVAVYDVLGQKVAELVNEEKQAGAHQLQFNTGNLSNGIYFYRLQTADYQAARKLRIVR